MKLHIPELTPDKFLRKELEIYQNLDNENFGEQLALRVAQKLKANPTESGGLYHAHRDYCGMGLYIHNGKFTLGTVNDGRGPYPIVADFDTEAAFISWLAYESDQSMAMYGEQFNNQTLTKLRLEWFLEEDYSSVWNAYCFYLRKREETNR
ncbi:hypothetical protein [Algoriphagus resistens]|uniref:hypothetical protein n=1 Tax=Algoriphagus resistens TaxID=1750590 RepID=UPI0007167BD8|nr:hypothetical protein [Algoriphagus resistens]